MSKETNTIKLGMPFYNWIEIEKKLREIGVEPEPFMICRDYGKLYYDIVKVKFEYWKKEKLLPENYMTERN